MAAYLLDTHLILATDNRKHFPMKELEFWAPAF